MSKNIEQQYLEIEQRVINLMLRYRDIVAEMIDNEINSDFFDSRHRFLVQSIYHVYHISDGKRTLSDAHYRELLIQQGVKGDITIAMGVYHECMFGVSYTNTKDDFDLLLKQLVQSFVHRRGVVAMERYTKEIPKLGYLEATKSYIKELSAVVNLTTFHRPKFLMLDEVKDLYIKEIKEDASDKGQVYRCGIPEIDEAMNIGFKPGQTSLFIGPPGGHKTNALLNISLRLYDAGASVLFLPLEMNYKDFVTRLVSNRAGVSYSKLLNPAQLTKNDFKKIEETKLWLRQDNRFAILDIDERLSVQILAAEVEKRLNYFKPDVVVLDYLGLMRLDTHYGSRHDLALGELTKGLKYLGKRYNFHVLTAAQLGRADIKRLRDEGPDAQLDTTSVRGSHEISADVEFIFALSPVSDEPDRLKLHRIKSRYGPAGSTVELHLIADHCIIQSTQPTITSLSSSEDAMEEWTMMNQTPEEAKKQADEIQFQGMNPDDLDDLEVF